MEIKKEKFNLQSVMTTASRDVIQIESPDQINKEILIDYKNHSKPVKLITMDMKQWVTKVVHFDNEFLYVRVPPELKSSIGTLILVEFSTVEGDYIIQTLVYQVRSPVLCLQFQHPRKDTRYLVPSGTLLSYARVRQDYPWVRDNSSLVVRNSGSGKGGGGNIVVKETVAIPHDDNEDADGYIDISGIDMKTGELENISIGGCSFIADGENISSDSLIYITIELKSISDGAESVQLSLFAIICHNSSLNKDKQKYGVRFLRRIIHEPLNHFFEKWLIVSEIKRQTV